MHRRNQHHSFGDSGIGAALLDFIGDIDDFLALLGVEGQIGCMGLHAGCFCFASLACQESFRASSNRPRHSASDVTVVSNTRVSGPISPRAPSSVNVSRSTDWTAPPESL